MEDYETRIHFLFSLERHVQGHPVCLDGVNFSKAKRRKENVYVRMEKALCAELLQY